MRTDFVTVQPHDMIEFIHMSSEALPDRLPAVTSEEFRRACGRFATGVTIATILDEEGLPHGLTVSSFSSVSLSPPLVSICLGHAVSIIELFRSAKYFGINILSADQWLLSDHFARRGHDRFQGVSWSPGETGVPLIYDALAAMECQLEQRIPAGDHDIFLGRMIATRVIETEPLLYFASAYHKLHR